MREALLSWFEENGRDLPWRRTRDPWRVLVSEVMLQQIQVKRAIPFYERFLERFPTVEALAEAPLSDAIRVWGDLGRYRRVVNLHRTARIVADEHPAAVVAVRAAAPLGGPRGAGAPGEGLRDGRAGGAQFAHGAGRAQGLAGLAPQGAQLHDGLAPPPGAVAGHHGLREAQELALLRPRLRHLRPEEEAVEHPPDVGVEEVGVALEGEARDGPGCVGAHAGQFQERFGVGRHLAAVLLDDEAGGPVEAHHPPVAAEVPHALMASESGASARARAVGKRATNDS